MKKVQNTNTQAPSVMYRIIIFVVSMSVILCAYFGISKIIQTEKEQEYTVGVYNNLIHYIEKAQVTDKELTISGWCFYAGVDSSRNKIQVFLKNVEDETDIVWLDVESVIRTDVDEYFNCEFDYSKTGFDATIKSKKVLLDEKNYEIFIKLTYFVDKVVQAGESEYIEEKEYIKTV